MRSGTHPRAGVWDRRRPGWIGSSWWPCAWSCCGRWPSRPRCCRPRRWRRWTRRWWWSAPRCSATGVWAPGSGVGSCPATRSPRRRCRSAGPGTIRRPPCGSCQMSVAADHAAPNASIYACKSNVTICEVRSDELVHINFFTGSVVVRIVNYCYREWPLLKPALLP